MEGGGRQRWTQERRRKEVNLYDEWLKEERAAERAQQAQQTLQAQQALHAQQSDGPMPARRQSSLPLRPGDTAGGLLRGGSAGTVRVVTPEQSANTTPNEEILAPERGTASFERAFIPFGSQAPLGTTTTIVGGPAAAPPTPLLPPQPSSPPGKSSRRSGREREWDREARGGQSRPSSRNGILPSGMLARSSSRGGNGQHAHAHAHATAVAAVRDAHIARPRTRTLEEVRRRERSPTSLMKNRNRMGSVHTTPIPLHPDADYLASGPSTTSSPAAASTSTLGSPKQAPADMAGRRSTSSVSSNTTHSVTSMLPAASAKRILHLTRTLNGVMNGNIIFRRGEGSPWSQIYCYVNEDTGSLMYEPRGGDGAHRTLIPDLRGCSVVPSVEEVTPHLEVSAMNHPSEIHVRLLTQADFDSWFATFLWWQSSASSKSLQYHDSHRPRGPYDNMTPLAHDPPPRTSSARQRERAGSGSRSDRRKSTVSTTTKDSPVIKIGKMVFWDTNVGYSNSPGVGQSGAARPQVYRMQSYGSRRWRRISGQLRENGELKLHADADNGLISVVQLSQLSRCAIQRLDPSVLENDFCIAVYPQYTSSPNSKQPGFLRPIFLSLENRMLYEVWFVLLRAFTLPQLYGPPTLEQGDDTESSIGAENLHPSTTNDMFRLERSLSMRIVEAKLYPPMSGASASESGFVGGHSRSAPPGSRPEQCGYYAEVLLDNETRGRTSVKYEGFGPLWGESFEFIDLPTVLTSASVVIKRRPPDSAHAREQHESRLIHEAYGFTSDNHGGFTALTFDATCGKVEIQMHELEEEKEVDKWWPVVTMHNQRIGEVLIRARADEGVILMAHDYQPLSELLHRFSNGLTLQIAGLTNNELKRLSDCLLNIYQVSGTAGDWLQSLIEEEIDGIHKETPISRLRYSRRMGSNDSNDSLGTMGHSSDRELIVRDLNKNATLEANLLFRGNTLLTKSLDTHMRRVGKEYLEESLAAKVKDINDKDPDCEVDPNRVHSSTDLDRNWRRLLLSTQEVWKAILTAKARCPVELRMLFRHIRACAEDRYGDFMRSVSYSSVSGFLFLRFFCPAVLNPKLFGLLKDDIKPRTRRTFTLIAKSLQTLANMANFGTKEHWMEPMNTFLTQHRESFKNFIDDVCYVPTSSSTATHQSSVLSSHGSQPGVVSAETHLSYTTPMTIMQRLPPTSREGFPSLPYLIDQARAFADLVQLWLEITSPESFAEAGVSATRRRSDIKHAIHASEGDLLAFHEICSSLNRRTQECLNRAERAERPPTPSSFQWDEIIDSLQVKHHAESGDDLRSKASFDTVADKIANDPWILPPGMLGQRPSEPDTRHREWDTVTDEDDEEAHASRLYEQTPPRSLGTSRDVAETYQARDHRPGSTSVGSSIQGSIRRALPSRGSAHSTGQSASASASNVSSAVSSDTEHTAGTTALPSYEREIRHRELREQAKQQIQQQVEDAKTRERAKEEKRRKVKTPLGALRKRKERDGKGLQVSHP